MHWGIRKAIRTAARIALTGMAIGAGGIAGGAALYAINRKRSNGYSPAVGIRGKKWGVRPASRPISGYYSKSISASSAAINTGRMAMSIYSAYKAGNAQRRDIGSNIYRNSVEYNRRMARRQDAISAFGLKRNHVVPKPHATKPYSAKPVNRGGYISPKTLSNVSKQYARAVSRTPDVDSYTNELLRRNQRTLRGY